MTKKKLVYKKPSLFDCAIGSNAYCEGGSAASGNGETIDTGKYCNNGPQVVGEATSTALAAACVPGGGNDKDAFNYEYNESMEQTRLSYITGGSTCVEGNAATS